MSGTEVWGANQIREWLTEPLRGATAEWTDNPDRTWDEIKSRLLEKLDLQDSTDFPVVDQLVAHVEQLSSEDERRTFLLDESTRDETISGLVEQYCSEVPPEPYWDEANQRYLRWDAAASEWVPMAAEEPTEPEPHWDEENQRYLRWDATAGEWVPMEEQAPAESAPEAAAVAEYVATVTDLVIDEFEQNIPDLAKQLGITEEELAAELAELTPDEVAMAIVEALPEAS